MPDSVTLRTERDGSNALTEVTVGTGSGETIVFHEGTFYPSLPGSPSREYDEYLVVRAESLPLLAGRLGVEGAPIEEIFAAVVELARAREVNGLAAARRLLDGSGFRMTRIAGSGTTESSPGRHRRAAGRPSTVVSS